MRFFLFLLLSLFALRLEASDEKAAPNADAEFPWDAHVAIVYYTGSLDLETDPQANPPSTGNKLKIKVVHSSSPTYPEGFNFFFWQNETTKKWIYGGDISLLHPHNKTPQVNIGELAVRKKDSRTADPYLLFSRFKVTDQSIGEFKREVEPILSNLTVKAKLEKETSDGNLEKLHREETPNNPLLPSGKPSEIPIRCVSLDGVLQTEDLKQAPLSSAPFLNHYQFDHATAYFPITDIEMAEAWIAGYCAANNHTIAGRTGQDVFGVAFLGRIVTSTGGRGYNLHYYVAYGCLNKSPSGSIDKYKYGVAPEIDIGLTFLNPFAGDSQEHAREKAADRAAAMNGVAVTTAPQPVPETLSDKFFDHFTPTWPSLSYDKTTGLEQSTSFKFQPKAATPADSGDAKNSPQFSLPFGGMNSFEKDYYSITAGPNFKFKTFSLAGTFDHSALPKGGVTQRTTDGKFVFASSMPSKSSTFTYGTTLAYSAISTPAGTTGSLASAQNTDEYSGTGFIQELVYLGDGRSKSEQNNESSTMLDPGKLGPNGEFDISGWFKPTESSQNSHFYADAIARTHIDVDVPTPDTFPGPIQFLRLDFALTGGGIVGVSPTYDRFNAGSNINEGATSPEMPTSPTVRSLGANSANVYNRAFKTSGATSYGDASFTMAIPVPYLCWSVYHRHEGKERGTVIATGLDNISEQNNLDYAAYYADIFSLKPLLACDAAYLGAPAGFADRSIVSLGAGGELSLGPLNVDFLYAKTYCDNSNQTKSANLTVQATYDIHF